jgi:hypothetical protein
MAWFPSIYGLACLALSQLFILSPAQTSTSSIGTYSATPIRENPHGIPTLVYNCAKMPAICTNVHWRNSLQAEPAAGGQNLGQLAGGAAHIELHYDTDVTRKAQRRDSVCTSDWARLHPCPENNPAQPPTVPSGASYNRGSWPAQRFNPSGLTISRPGYNRIADDQGNDSGLIWTCDEWPPAM